MSTKHEVRNKYADTPLRKAQRELTRKRIREAARIQFYQLHYDAVTMDQIANAAGLRRSTLYLHYKDKAEMLVDITADYTPRAVALMKRLPGPSPSTSQITAWLHKVVDFFVAEKVPLAIFLETGKVKPGLAIMEQLTQVLLAALAENIPAFERAASNRRADLLIRARAILLINRITFVCNYAALGEGQKEVATAFLRVTAEELQAFITT